MSCHSVFVFLPHLSTIFLPFTVLQWYRDESMKEKLMFLPNFNFKTKKINIIRIIINHIYIFYLYIHNSLFNFFTMSRLKGCFLMSQLFFTPCFYEILLNILFLFIREKCFCLKYGSAAARQMPVSQLLCPGLSNYLCA